MTFVERLGREATLGYGETWVDALTLIGITAEARSRARGEPVSEETYSFAATVWCFLTDVVKPPTYQEDARSLRSGFKGIAHEPESQDRLRKGLDAKLIAAPLVEVVERGIRDLVHVEFA